MMLMNTSLSLVDNGLDGLYAQNCPEEPKINRKSMLDVRSRKNTHKKMKKLSQNFCQKIIYAPNIIRAGNRQFQKQNARSYQQLQHRRQLKSLKKRIQNCKNINQRKKDHNDPLLYPSYFIREKTNSKDARLDGYYKKILSKYLKQESSSTSIKNNDFKHIKSFRQNQIQLKEANNPQAQAADASQVPIQQLGRLNLRGKKSQDDLPNPKLKLSAKINNNIPNPSMAGPAFEILYNCQSQTLSKRIPNQKATALQGVKFQKQGENILNLPRCSSDQIIEFITLKRMFKRQNLKILYARMCHYYGREKVDPQWNQVQNNLEIDFNR